MPIGTTIDGLNAVTSLTTNDEVPVWDAEASGEPTRKITAQNFTNSVKTLGSLVNTTEMNTAIAQSTAGGGTWTAKFYAGSTQLSITIASATYKRIGDVVFANIRGTFSSQASGGIYFMVNSGLPAIPSTCALSGTFIVDTAVGTLFHSNGTNHSVYFRLFDGMNQQGASVSGKVFEVSFFYTAS